MRKNFAVIGLGTFGTAVAETLAKNKHYVVAIDNDENALNPVKDIVTHSVILNATDEKALKSIDIQDVDAAIIGVGNIQDSILITLLLKEMGVSNIIAKAINQQHQKVLKKIGANKIILPEIEVGINVANSLISTKIFDQIEMSKKYSMAEINPIKKWFNRTIFESNIRRNYGVTVVGIKRKFPHIDEKGEMTQIEDIIISPAADTEILKNDTLIIIGDKNSIIKLQKL